MSEMVVKTNTVEDAIVSYRREKTRRYKKEWLRKRLEKEPDYFHKGHQARKENERKQNKAYIKKRLSVLPRALTDDMKEWKRRRCLEYKDIADMLGLSEKYLHGMMNRQYIPSKALLKLLDLRYDYTDKEAVYKRRYSSKKYASYSICTDCTTRGCSWLENLEPVHDWVAQPTHIENSNTSIDSYKVTACPLYTDSNRNTNDETNDCGDGDV